MNARRFRPTLDTLPSRVTPSDFGTTISVTAPPSESISEAETTITCYQEILATQPLEPKISFD